MLRDTLQEFLAGTQRKLNDKVAGAHLKRFYEGTITEDISIISDLEPLPEHYKELLAALRRNDENNIDIRLLRKVVANKLRDILVERDAQLLVDKILTVARERQRITLNRALLRGTLRTMDRNGSPLESCVDYLKRLPAQKMTGLWWQRCEQYALLNKPYGQFLAIQLFSASSTATGQELLVQSGLRELGDDGLRQLVHRRITEQLAELFKNVNIYLDKHLTAFKVWEKQAVSEVGFRFAEERNYTAESLLLPWKNVNPEQKLKGALLKFFLEYYGDPRIGSGWLRVGPEPQKIIRRWLAEASFELFISIIKKTAPKQWQDREKFWRYYLERDFVLDLTVAFGNKAFHIANKMNQESDLKNQLIYSLLKGSSSSNQSVMVMKFNRCTVVEWSHSGKFRLWRDGNPHAPRLNQKDYLANTVRNNTSDEEIVHSGAWLEKIGAALHKYSGIKPRY